MTLAMAGLLCGHCEVFAGSKLGLPQGVNCSGHNGRAEIQIFDDDRNAAQVATEYLLGMSSEPQFVILPESDPFLIQAHQKAKENLRAFHAAFKKRTRDETDYRVKVHFPRSDGSEGAHIWLAVIDCLDDLLFCTLRELPSDFVGLKLGETQLITDERVEDWMFLTRDGKCFGGYSLRLIRSQLATERRVEFDSYVGVSVWSNSLP
jgi:uncharacterized protein YegJ (DUF2314 family)